MSRLVVDNYVHRSRRRSQDGMFTGISDEISRRRIAAALGVSFRRLGRSKDDLRAAMRVEGDYGAKYLPSAEAGYDLDTARANSAMRSFGGDKARDCDCGDCADCRDKRVKDETGLMEVRRELFDKLQIGKSYNFDGRIGKVVEKLESTGGTNAVGISRGGNPLVRIQWR